MKFNKRGQSALEYLVTYGWAILAIVVVAAVLWYFGVFNPGNFASQSASARGFGDFSVVDQKYAGTELILVVGNAVGQQVNVTGISVAGVAGTLNPTSTLINAGEQATLNATVGACGTAGTQYDSEVTITYTNIKSGVEGKTSSGTLKGSCA